MKIIMGKIHDNRIDKIGEVSSMIGDEKTAPDAFKRSTRPGSAMGPVL